MAYDHTRSLFLGNLPYDVDEEDATGETTSTSRGCRPHMSRTDARACAAME